MKRPSSRDQAEVKRVTGVRQNDRTLSAEFTSSPGAWATDCSTSEGERRAPANQQRRGRQSDPEDRNFQSEVCIPSPRRDTR